MYEYKAFITAVYDGDTVTANIDLGCNVWLHGEKLRLFGIDAPEVRGEEREEGLKSRDWLRSVILNREVVVKTKKDKKGKYGRYLAEILVEGVDVATLSVAAGMAQWAEY